MISNPQVLFLGPPLRTSLGIMYCEDNNIPYLSIEPSQIALKKQTKAVSAPIEKKYAKNVVNLNDLQKNTHQLPFDYYYNIDTLSAYIDNLNFFPNLIVSPSDVQADLRIEQKLMNRYMTISYFCHKSYHMFYSKTAQRSLWDALQIPRVPDPEDEPGCGVCVKRDKKTINKESQFRRNLKATPKFRYEPYSYMFSPSDYEDEFFQKWMDIEYGISLFIHIDSHGVWTLQFAVKEPCVNGGWRPHSIGPYKLTPNEESQINLIMEKLSKKLDIRCRLIYFELMKCYDDDTIYPHDFNCRPNGSFYQVGRYFNSFAELISDKRQLLMCPPIFIPHFLMEVEQITERLELKDAKPVATTLWFYTGCELQ